ncbi:MAG TPA: riboflavin kinase [Candidatus Magasanikbacteria bacterium]|nr:riboflavin kinase [Candidatus Magasanikbacteria bacterium]
MLHITGVVVQGEQRGRILGFPTANIDIKKKKLYVTPGIFAGWAVVGKKRYMAGVFIPHTLDRVEAHLLDYPGESLYGKHIEVEVLQKVSEIERYDTIDELIAKIKSDLELVREVLEK